MVFNYLTAHAEIDDYARCWWRLSPWPKASSVSSDASRSTPRQAAPAHISPK